MTAEKSTHSTVDTLCDTQLVPELEKDCPLLDSTREDFHQQRKHSYGNTSMSNSSERFDQSTLTAGIFSQGTILDYENTKVVQVDEYPKDTNDIEALENTDKEIVEELSSFNISEEDGIEEEPLDQPANHDRLDLNEEEKADVAYLNLTTTSIPLENNIINEDSQTTRTSNFSINSSLTRLTPIKIRNKEQLSQRREKRQSRLLSTQILRAKLAGSPVNSDNDDNDELGDEKSEIDIDNSMSFPQVPLFEIKNSPWNLTRTPNAQRNSGNDLSNVLSSLNISDFTGGKSVSTSYEVEKLQKALTDCKIQLKLQRELLSDRYGKDSSILKTLERQMVSSIEGNKSKKEIEQLNIQVSNLSDENLNLKTELKELLDSFDILQNQLEILQSDHESSKLVANEIIELLVAFSHNNKFSESLMSCRNSDSLKIKLNSLGYYIEQIFNDFRSRVESLTVELKQETSNGVRKDQLIDKLTDKLKAILSNEKQNDIRYNELNRLISTEMNNSKDHSIDFEALKREVDLKTNKISELNGTNSALMFELRDLKDRLERHHHDPNAASPVKEEQFNESELFKQLKDVESINNELKSQISGFKTEHTRLESIVEQLQNSSKIDELQSQLSVLQKNYNSSMVKLRRLNSEKIRLSHEIQASDKKVQSLTTELTDQQTLNDALEQENDSLSSSLNGLGHQLQYLLTSDVNFQTHLIKILTKIIDSKSIKEVASKILQLADRDKLQLDVNTVNEIYDSIFQYDISAIRTIVKAHNQLEAESQANGTADSETISSLKGTILTLEDKVSQLTSLLDKSQEKENFGDTNGSPRSKLRLDELTKRWKSAEESLALERKQSKKRLDDLESENAKLRAELGLTINDTDLTTGEA